MGLDNRQEGKFINIYKGKFSQRVQEGTPGAQSRILEKGKNAGNPVFEKFYDSFTGKLVDIKMQDGEYGKSWIFSFKDQGEVYNLQLSYSNSFATALLKMLPNVDLSQEFKVSPSTKEVDGKNKSSLFINQNGVPVKHAYTRENPNGMPDMEQVTVKGQLVWDDTKRLEFLYDMVATQIIPKLEGTEVPQAQITEPESDPEFDNFGKSENKINPDDVAF